MAITQDDVRLYASERMTDYADGGGRMSPHVIVDGQDNNVFPDITDLDRITGRTSIRKIFGAVTSTDNDTYLGAHAFLDDAPDDEATGAAIFSTGGLTTERSEAQQWFDAHDSAALAPGAGYSAGGTATSGSAVLTGCTFSDTLLFDSNLGGYFRISASVGGVASYALRRVLSRAGTDLTLDAPLTFPNGTGVAITHIVSFSTQERSYGVAATTGALASGATSVPLVSRMATVAPYADCSPAPVDTEAALGIDATKYLNSAGAVPIFVAGDKVLVHSTIAMAPAARANGDTVNTTRTTLARLRVIGNNGVEHARFTRGVPPPAGVGCTADLDAGTVTFTDVSGMSQPVTVEHRIEELNQAIAIAGATLTLNRGLSRAYPAGTKVSSLMLLGDLQGRVEAGFAQQAWTGIWQDSRIGGEPLADFNDVLNPITTTNRGSVTQRWALIFTNSTTFRVVGEFLGEVGTGNTGGNCTPNNPATSSPYFTIPAAGWGTGWSAGNVYRFNTVGAQAPLWVLRCVAPSLPNPDDDSVTVEFRGFINT